MMGNADSGHEASDIINAGKKAYKVGKHTANSTANTIKIIKKILGLGTAAGIAIFLFFLLMIVSVVYAAGEEETAKAASGATSLLPISEAAEAYRETVTGIAKEYGLTGYEDLIIAIIQVKSGGAGTDVMSASLFSYNTQYPEITMGIKDPAYSIRVGTQQLRDDLSAANVQNPQNNDNIITALYLYDPDNTAFPSDVMKYYLKLYGEATFGYPVDTIDITDYFGYRIHPITGEYKMHTGVDFAVPYRSNIYAAESGQVVVATYDRSFGREIIIQHGSNVQTLYAHNSVLLVKVGQMVEKGQIIALAGSTGDSTGNHCHFGVSVNGVWVDPLLYLPQIQ